MLWRPNNREIMFQGKEEAEWGYHIADLYIPVPQLHVLADDNGKLEAWCWDEWQKDDHGCICKRENGVCRPDVSAFRSLPLQRYQDEATVWRSKLICLHASSVGTVFNMLFTVAEDIGSHAIWLEEFSIEFRFGELFPEYLELMANGCLSG